MGGEPRKKDHMAGKSFCCIAVGMSGYVIVCTHKKQGSVPALCTVCSRFGRLRRTCLRCRYQCCLVFFCLRPAVPSSHRAAPPLRGCSYSIAVVLACVRPVHSFTTDSFPRRYSTEKRRCVHRCRVRGTAFALSLQFLLSNEMAQKKRQVGGCFFL